MNALADRIKLATLSCGAWRPYRRHKAETAAEQSRHCTSAVSVRVRLTDSCTLRGITAHQESTMRTHRALTFPTPSAEMRMLVAGKELEHAAAMREATVAHTRLVDQFIAEYPDIRAAAQIELGSLYEPEAWPDAESVRARFKFAWRYLRCPSEGEWGEWLDEAVGLARADMEERLREALAHYSERLRNAERLHVSVAENLRAASNINSCEPILTTGAIDDMAYAISDLPMDISALRTDDALRQAAAAKADALLERFGGVTL